MSLSRQLFIILAGASAFFVVGMVVDWLRGTDGSALLFGLAGGLAYAIPQLLRVALRPAPARARSSRDT
jgi:hypothetical protein